MNSYNQFESTQGKTVSNFGLISKTLLGVIIVFMVAIPRLFNGQLFLSFLYNTSNIIMYLILTIFVTIVLSFIWMALYRALRASKGFILDLFIFVIACGFLGLFIANSLIFAVYFIGYYAQGSVDVLMVYQALKIASVATFIAITGGTLVLPKLSMQGRTIRLFGNFAKILVGLSMATFFLWIIGLILSIFGLTFILDALYNMLYGIGPISIVLSVIVVLASVFTYLVMLARAKMAVGNEPKHLEYFYAMLLVNAIARVYVEVFKLVLKILAARNRD